MYVYTLILKYCSVSNRSSHRIQLRVETGLGQSAYVG